MNKDAKIYVAGHRGPGRFGHKEESGKNAVILMLSAAHTANWTC